MPKIPVSNFDRDMIMAARYAYYVCQRPFLEDQHYDEMEAEFRLVHGEYELPPVGSEYAHHYTPAQRSLALYFLLSGRGLEPPPTDTSLL